MHPCAGEDADDEKGGGLGHRWGARGVWEFSVLSAGFGCDPKSTLKITLSIYTHTHTHRLVRHTSRFRVHTDDDLATRTGQSVHPHPL